MSHPNRSDEVAWVFLEEKKNQNLIAGSKNKDSAFVFFRCRRILSTQITFKILILNPLSSSEEDIRRTVGTDGKFCYLEHSFLSKISCAFKKGRGKCQQIARYCISSSCNQEEERHRWYSTCSLERTVTRSLVILSGWGWSSGCLTPFLSFPLLWEFWHLHSYVFSSSDSWVIWMTDWTQVFACVSVLWLRIASFMRNWEWISGDPSYILRRYEMEVPKQTGVPL